MSKLTLLSDSDEILPLARRLRDGIARETPLSTLIEKLASWGARLLASRACNVPGAAYLSMWLRRENLQRLLEADFGCAVSGMLDRKSTRLNSSHVSISYAVFCLKKKRDVLI